MPAAAPLRAWLAALAFAALCSGAAAQSLRPVERPADLPDPSMPGPPAARDEDLGLSPRPNTPSLVPLSRAPPPAPSGSAGLPAPRPDAPVERTSNDGRVCGIDGVEGVTLPPISNGGGCGIERPVRVARIAGVDLEPSAVLGCSAVEALEGWLTAVAQPAFRRAGRPLAGIGVAASYVCRNVNSAPEGKLSHHALGGAIDIARFRSDAGELNIRDDWSGKQAALLRQIYAGACGTFGTTLGPDTNRYHRDHFHFDVAERRAPYCP
jgi:hypothetical protein